MQVTSDQRPWIQTEAATRVARGLDRLQRMPGLMVLSGPNGLGKSEAIRAAAESVPLVHSLVMPPGKNPSIKGFLGDIAYDLGVTIAAQLGIKAAAHLVAGELRKRGAILVLDNAELMVGWQLDTARTLLDLGVTLALSGEQAILHKVRRHGALSARFDLPLEMQPVSRQELGEAFGHEFSADWLDEAHTLTSGNWRGLWKLVHGERQFSAGRTQDAGRDAARETARVFAVAA